MAKLGAAVLEYRSGAYRELLRRMLFAAAPAIVRLAFAGLAIPHLINVHAAAPRARRVLATTLLFHELDRCRFVRARQRDRLKRWIVLRGAVLNLSHDVLLP